MVSHQYRCIFIHIPKCAGTSIESAFGHLDGYSGRDGQDHRSIRLIEKPVLKPQSLLTASGRLDIARRIRNQLRTGMNPRNKIGVTRQQYRDYFKFTFVRSPWSRAYSMYKNVLRDELHRSRLGIPETMAFPDFMASQAGKDMLRPQTYWLKDSFGNIPMDFIGKFENLETDFKYVCQQLGAVDISLPHKIRGESAGFEAHFDSSTHQLIRKIYAEDIKLFNYD